jgi:hypothetical protein
MPQRGSAAVLPCLGAASQWRVREPRDRGLAIGNRSRRWRQSPPHWYWRIRICRDYDSGQKRRTQDRVLSRCVLEFDGAVSGRDESTGSGSQVNRLVSKAVI